jgi:hypothetical protein
VSKPIVTLTETLVALEFRLLLVLSNGLPPPLPLPRVGVEVAVGDVELAMVDEAIRSPPLVVDGVGCEDAADVSVLCIDVVLGMLELETLVEAALVLRLELGNVAVALVALTVAFEVLLDATNAL